MSTDRKQAAKLRRQRRKHAAEPVQHEHQTHSHVITVSAAVAEAMDYLEERAMEAAEDGDGDPAATWEAACLIRRELGLPPGPSPAARQAAAINAWYEPCPACGASDWREETVKDGSDPTGGATVGICNRCSPPRARPRGMPAPAICKVQFS